MRFAYVVIHHLLVQVERIGKAWDQPLIIGGFPVSTGVTKQVFVVFYDSLTHFPI